MRITEAQLRKIIRQRIQEAIKDYSNDPVPAKIFSGSTTYQNYFYLKLLICKVPSQTL
jgi:hypothetical protein